MPNRESRLRAGFNRQQERLEQIKKQEAQRQQAQRQAEAAKAAEEANRETPAQAAQDAQKVQRESGVITQIGEALQGAMNAPANFVDEKFNEFTEGLSEDNPLRGPVEFLNDNVFRSADEQLEQAAEIPVVGPVVVGGGAGIEGGLALPFTVAGRLANQDTPWADPPAVIKGSALGETAFEIAQVLTPTLLGGLIAGPGAAGVARTGTGALATESLVETATQDSMEDAIAGRFQAQKIGELADALGFDGGQLTRDLIEGKTIKSQAMTAAILFLQNLAINKGADEIVFQIQKKLGKRAVSETAEKIAARTGKSAEEVDASLNNTYLPDGLSKDMEVSEVADIDSIVPVAKPSPGNEYVNTDAVGSRILNGNLDADGFTAADRTYFTNYRALSRKGGTQKVLQEVSDAITPYLAKNAGDEARLIARRGLQFVKEFVDDAGRIDLDSLTKGIVDDTFSEVPLVKQLEGTEGVELLVPNMSKDTLLRNYRIMTPEGAAAMYIVNEEIGIRTAQAATRFINLQSAGDDALDALKTFVDSVDTSQQLLIPLRRFKRKWATSGFVQNPDFISSANKTDLSKATTPNSVKEGTEYAASSELENLSEGIQSLYGRALDGDKDAYKTLVDYASLVAYSSPKYATRQIADIEKTLLKEIKKGNVRATKQLFYSYMLTRINPQSASIGSNILNLLKEPLGAYLSGERAYGLGQLQGGTVVLADAFKNMAETFKTGQGWLQSSKLDLEIKSRKQIDLELDRQWEGIQRKLNRENANWFVHAAANANHLKRKFSNSYINQVAARALNAGDSFANTIFAGQVAMGRAFKRMTEEGVKRNSFASKRIIKEEYDKIFADGIKGGELLDPNVARGARTLTFQGDIPSNGNFVDNAFKAIDDGSKNSAFINVFSAFTKLGYNTLEQSGQLLASSVPGGEWLLTRIPRYNDTLMGKYGDVAQMQLKSNLAFGRYFMLLNSSMALGGMATGQNPPPGMPKTSYIFPAPWTNKGYVAFDYSIFEPVSTITSLQIDLVQNLRDNLISEQDYQKAFEELMYSLGMSTLDKSFLSGISDMARLLDVSNVNQGTAVGVANLVGSTLYGQLTGGVGGLGRMVTDHLNPYQTVNKVELDLQENFFLAFRKRAFGGLGNPIQYDPYTGKPELKSLQLSEDKGLMFLGGLANESVPGRVRESVNSQRQFGDKNLVSRDKFKGTDVEYVFAHLDRLGIDRDVKKQLRSYQGIPLSAVEQSKLSQDMHTKGKLTENLTAYFNSDRFRNAYNHFKKLDKQYGRESEIAQKKLQQIKSQVNAVYTRAKQYAVMNGELGKADTGFLEKFNQRKNPQLGLQSSLNPEIEEILSIPT